MKKLGYLGPPGTFSHTAAIQFGQNSGYIPVCCAGLESIFRRVQLGELDAGIVPVENSTVGSVGETLDLLSAVDGVVITGELMLPVRHHLLARPGVNTGEIKRVYSHPQALAQCRCFLREHLPGIPVSETVSTAAAALQVSSSVEPLAAIGSLGAAETYGLEPVCFDIQGNGDNVTRFLVLGREKAVFKGPAKTSMVLAVRDRPGALYHILREFALFKINLTRIESRPAGKKLGDYIFFIDFCGRDDDSLIKKVFRELAKFTLWIKVLGSYPACREQGGASTGVEERAANASTDLAGIRQKIDLVDEEIIYLLAMRQHLVDEIAAIKKSKDRIVDRRRENEVISRVVELAGKNNLDREIMENIYKLILRGSVSRQMELVGRVNRPVCYKG